MIVIIIVTKPVYSILIALGKASNWLAQWAGTSTIAVIYLFFLHKIVESRFVSGGMVWCIKDTNI